MSRTLLAALALAVLATAGAAQTATLYATLDLRQPLADGWVDPGETVGLRGSVAPLSWDATAPATDPDGDGLYTLAVPFAVSEDGLRVELKIKVDDRDGDAPNEGWQEGPNHAVALTAGVGAGLMLRWPARPTASPSSITGRIDTMPAVEGAGLAPRDVYVWLPPGYADTDARYPVLYLHDGAGVFGTEAGSEWGMDEAATALIEAGEIEPLIIVAVANTDRRTDEYTPTATAWERTMVRVGPPTASDPALGPMTGAFRIEGAPDDDPAVVALADSALTVTVPGQGGPQPLQRLPDGRFYLANGDITLEPVRDADGAVRTVRATRPPAGGLGEAYGQFLVDVLKPQVDELFRTRPGPQDTGLGGASLGGLITMHLGAMRPDVFGRLLVASPSVWWDDKVLLRTVAAVTPSPGQRVWVDIGTDEGGSMVPDARRLAALLVETGWDAALVRYVEAEGAGHDTGAWQARAPDMLRFLFPTE
ncbi:alpha/beta hydrolase-fold protein [Rubrivirga sp. IMCC45206]|uniref:alpha/beta hydrolase-fold protein n=1 Tax=Rubrivirga sp. IMCC45206 TaxID=3391614 RepID=UPI00398FE236